MTEIAFDEVGYWSEVKQDIVQLYSEEYTKILRAQGNLRFAYIEGFSSSGIQVRKGSGELSFGSAIRAVKIEPPFDEYHFVDIDRAKLSTLERLVNETRLRRTSRYYPDDCNRVLLTDIFPQVRYEEYRRALCLLDPYGLDLDWAVIAKAGELGTIDLFLNFPVMDANRNALWRNPKRVAPSQAARLTRFWGDETWRDVAYQKQKNLFGEQEAIKTDNETVANAFRERLRNVAKFALVPRPVPMRNDQGATIYYLFFASQKESANRIASFLFEKYRARGAV